MRTVRSQPMVATVCGEMSRRTEMSVASERGARGVYIGDAGENSEMAPEQYAAVTVCRKAQCTKAHK